MIFQGEEISKIRADIEDENDKKINFHQLLEGNYFKVTDKTAPKVYDYFTKILDFLEFREPIDLFIASNPSINASTYPSLKADKPHIIVVNSGLLEKFSEDELKFTIGHEIGYIIFKSALLKDHVAFVFGEGKKMHLNFELKLNLWSKLAELSTDRIGLMVTDDISSCIRAFFKLSSGISPDAIGLQINEYRNQIDEIFVNFRKEFLLNSGFDTHPLILIRIKMLDAFYDSKTYSLLNSDDQHDDQGLQQVSSDIINLLFKYGDTGIDLHRKVFITSAGLLVAQIDGQIDDKEVKQIMETLTG